MLLFDLMQMLIKNSILFLVYFLLLIVPLLISVTVHEWAHGFAAYKFGDNTAKDLGRLTLNPLKHIDPIGALMLFIVGIGWAKPVPINPNNIRSRFGFFMVSIAGILSNFVLAIVFGFLFYFVSGKLYINLFDDMNSKIITLTIIQKLLETVVHINIMLGVFNLLPIPPLDGANIVRSVLPDNLAEGYFRIAPYGYIILLILLFTGGIKYISFVANFLQFYLIKFISILMNNFVHV
jgi:Zn-dependent protease